ncbi:unnamed protein product [Rhizoctonia solani]|uniref:Ricin B lectin domain-containing protein n=1 Tax=Rhizoctonia solani TaxID=456999 RepID=A0A8H3CQG1_9AGAM|nr:unnamed protein product [Rhizoctonia solani]
MSFQPGTYYLINVKHARDSVKSMDDSNVTVNEVISDIGQQVAAMDLSDGDKQSIIAFGWHGGDNQKWQFEDAGDGNYYIKNVGFGKYLTFPDEPNDGKQVFINVGFGKYLTFPDEPNDGKQVIATDGPRPWEVRVGREGENQQDSKESIRIFVPGTSQNLDLTNHGDITPGNPVQLWEQTPGQGQAWYAIPA